MPAKAGGGTVFCIDDNPGHRQHRARIYHFLAGVGKQNRAQTFSPEIGVNGKPPDKRNRYGVSGQFLRQGFGQFGACHATGAQHVKTGKAADVMFGRGQKHARHVSSNILGCVAAYVFIEQRLSAMK